MAKSREPKSFESASAFEANGPRDVGISSQSRQQPQPYYYQQHRRHASESFHVYQPSDDPLLFSYVLSDIPRSDTNENLKHTESINQASGLPSAYNDRRLYEEDIQDVLARYASPNTSIDSKPKQTTTPYSLSDQKRFHHVKTSPSADHLHSLIDFGSPPMSPYKPSTPIEHSTFQYVIDASASEKSDADAESLIKEFAQLPANFNDDGHEFDVGSLVEVTVNGREHCGVVRWSDRVKNKSQQCLVGVELESDIEDGTDGTYFGQHLFRCPPGRGVVVPMRNCKLDPRFSGLNDVPQPSTSYDIPLEMENGGPDCPSVAGEIPPVGQFGDWSKLIGRFRGIQGHHNSCYLDATLFSMFTFTSIFDGLLFRPPTREDIPQYEEVQRILREDIVNPLRQHFYVRADKVMRLRRLLQKLSSVTGLTNEEKDPEEFLHCLLAQTLKAEPFLKLSSGQEAYHHQLFVEKDEKLLMPTVQQLFEQSFLSSGIKLKEVPPVLIIQMPRFGKSYKMYPYVLPSALLDITDVLENSPRQCIVCGHLAELECQQCLGQCGTGLESIAFCTLCLEKAHRHKKRTTHQAQMLQVPPDFAALKEHCNIPRMYMELFAVVCIATSHYVTFVKCGPGPDAPWCFFDSMADRRGEQNGFNIPEVTACPDLSRWLSDDWDKQLLGTDFTAANGQSLPDHVRRLFSDAYMCLYQSPDLSLYR